MKEIRLTLSVDETNKVLDALSQLPFIQVHQLIGKIHESARAQLSEEAEEAQPVLDNIKSIANG